jgi:hypothetical protein
MFSISTSKHGRGQIRLPEAFWRDAFGDQYDGVGLHGTSRVLEDLHAERVGVVVRSVAQIVRLRTCVVSRTVIRVTTSIGDADER